MSTYFSINKYNLKGPSLSFNQKSLVECKKLTIQNNKAGFHYFGNNNQCHLYGSNIPDIKLDKDLLNNFNVSKYNKVKNQKEASVQNQSDLNFYFNKTNHFGMNTKNKLKNYSVQTLNQCQEKCLDHPLCKSISYFQQPLSCTLYNSVRFGKFHKNYNNDVYTIDNKSINNNKVKEEKKDINIHKNKKNQQEKKILGSKYTTCFSNGNFKDFSSLKNSYDKICSSQFGSEYKFVNYNDDQNSLHCKDENKIKIRCVPQFIEHFQNKQINNLYYILFIIILMIIIGSFYLKK